MGAKGNYRPLALPLGELPNEREAERVSLDIMSCDHSTNDTPYALDW